MKVRALLIIALSACASANTGPDPSDGLVTQRSTRYYNVDPSSSDALNRSIVEERRNADRNHNIGEAHWETRWSYEGTSGPGGCTLGAVRVEVKTQISLPRWTPPGATSPARREWWNRIQFAVTQHERHHMQIAEDGGRTIATTLRSLHSTDCATLRRMAESFARTEMDNVKARQREFDRSEGPLVIPAPPP